jgi:hypothetical protein
VPVAGAAGKGADAEHGLPARGTGVA